MEFLSEVWAWYWRHQPVMPFPFILPFVGAWWGEQVTRFLTEPIGSKQVRNAGDRVVGGFMVWAIAAFVGIDLGHWYFLIPLAAGTLAWFFIRFAAWALTESESTSVPVTDTPTPAGTPVADMDPATAIRKAERAIAEYRQLLPAARLESIRDAEFADARLTAFRKLFDLLHRLDEVSLLDDKRFGEIVREADALFTDVSLDPSVVENFRGRETGYGAMRVTVRRALESLFYEILQLPIGERIRNTDLSVPQEYVRLTQPGENGSSHALPVIAEPERDEALLPTGRPKLTA